MKRQPYKLKVKTYCINKGQPSQYFGLKTVEDNQVLHYAPNNWKTERGALNWAKRNGYEISEGKKVKGAGAKTLAKPTIKPKKATPAKKAPAAKKATATKKATPAKKAPAPKKATPAKTKGKRSTVAKK